MCGEDSLVYIFTHFVSITCEQYTCPAYFQVHICVKNLVGVCVSRLYVFLYYKCLSQRGVETICVFVRVLVQKRPAEAHSLFRISEERRMGLPRIRKRRSVQRQRCVGQGRARV